MFQVFSCFNILYLKLILHEYRDTKLCIGCICILSKIRSQMSADKI